MTEHTVPAFEQVVAIMHRLRGPGGCPWDRAQTLDSIRPHTIEETFEVLEAIGERNWSGLCEELGDLLLQVLFYAEIAAEDGHFTIDEVLAQLAAKLVRRHPHVFGDEDAAATPSDALARWDAIKATEKPKRAASRLDGIAASLPGLAQAVKLGERAAADHFDWPSPVGVWAKLEEELGELRAAEASHDARAMEAEFGDVLFTLASLARHLQLEPESALRHANRQFERRFRRMETAAAARGLATLSSSELDALWQEAKRGPD